MKKTILTIIALFILTANCFADDLIQKTNRLKANGKSVMFIFETKTCPYCDLLKKDFVEDKELNALLQDMNIYSIPRDEYKEYLVGDKNPPKKENLKTLEKAFAVKVTPNIVIFDKHWNRIIQIPGYANPAQMKFFLKFLKGLENGKYKASDWNNYLNGKI